MSQSDRLGDEAGKDIVQPNSEANNMEKLNVDARDFLNTKRARQKDIEKPQKMGQQLTRNINSNKDNSLPIIAGTTDGNQIMTLGVQSYLVTSENNTNSIVQSIGKKVVGHVEKEAVLNAFASNEDLSEEELNAFASDEDLSEEEKEELDICFEKLARDEDLSLRQQRSGSNKNKKKTHRRQHSWDGKVTGEFIPRGSYGIPFSDDFTTYADVCFKKFGDIVLHWTTLNEANEFTVGNYNIGNTPPNHFSPPFRMRPCSIGKSPIEPYIADHNLLLTHLSMVKLYMS
ncbi:Beta-glucosidase 2 [Capsicum baccatum]|uniref:Beta-glucosidase 2 n=1 Tax=Capsicum baccatum TaxID=33114 RepID=A0A2G2XR61_CAPBA|nr:Beta-glucosidase 2 [Capsicum baccatum]